MKSKRGTVKERNFPAVSQGCSFIKGIETTRHPTKRGKKKKTVGKKNVAVISDMKELAVREIFLVRKELRS